MRPCRRWLVVLALALAALPASGGMVLAAEDPEASSVPGEVLVRFRADVSEQARDRAVSSAGARTERRFEELDARLVTTGAANGQALLKRLTNDPRVLYAEPNFVVTVDDVPNDPSFDKLWGLHNIGQTGGTADADIDAMEAWATRTDSTGVVVGIIDTGVDFGHPDLGASRTASPLLWTNPGEIPGNGIDDDGNGYVDDLHGWDFRNNDNDATDDNGHGTHVAGTIGALGNNGTGVTGLSWSGVEIMPLKFLSASGSGSTADAVEAVLYATNEGADLTNNSWGGGGYSQLLADAIQLADDHESLFVAAAGNDGLDTDTTPHYPSSYALPNVISVAATTDTDGKASFSNYGADSVDLGAPGSGIVSTWIKDGYRSASGTSMASPHVAGAAALLKAQFPGASDLGLKGLILGTTDPNTALAGRSRTGGRLNLGTAIACTGLQAHLEAPADGFATSVGETVTISGTAGHCGDPADVSLSATWNGVAIPLTVRSDGLFSGTYVPDLEGPVTLAVTASKTGVADTVTTVAGTVAAGYRHEPAAYDLTDASQSGANTGLNSDDGSVWVDLPFDFPYYGQPHSRVAVAANGYLIFGGDAAPEYYPSIDRYIPSTEKPDGVVAPFWDDLNPSYGGSIWTKTTGTAPNRQFVVTWKDVAHYRSFFGGVGAATFEVVLDEADGAITFHYADVVFGDTAYDKGAAAVVGVERPDGKMGTRYSNNQPVLDAGMAIRFVSSSSTTPTVGAPTNLTATPGASGVVDLSWTAPTDWTPASYAVKRGSTPDALSEVGTSTATSFQDTPASDGTYYYEIDARDGLGTTLSSSDQVLVTSDSVAPAAPTNLTIDPGDGWKEDHISSANHTAVSVSGSKPSDAETITLTFTQGTSSTTRTLTDLSTATTFADTAGADLSSWSDGEVSVTATATDAAGNTSSSSTALLAPKDTTPPDVTINSGPDGTVTVSDATFGFSSSDSSVVFECSLDGAVATACTSPTSYEGLANGDHTFAVIATDAAGNAASTSRTWTVNVASANVAPTAAFDWSCHPKKTWCDFTDASYDPDGSITGWQWDFGDGTTSNVQNPGQVRFPDSGPWTVTLTVTDDDAAPTTIGASVNPPGGSGSVTSGGATNAAPTASFTTSCEGLACTFTDTSTDTDGTVTEWSWDFGDGTTSTAQHPSHGYAAAGTYTATLTVTDGGGATDMSSQPVTVTTAGSGLALTTSGSKEQGRHQITLTWNAAAGGSYDVWYVERVATGTVPGDAQLATTAVSGPDYIHATQNKGGGTYTHWVCEKESTVCSNASQTSF